MLLLTDHNSGLEADLVYALVVMLIAGLLALVVWVGSKSVGRADLGGPAAVVILLVGAILALLAAA